MRVPPGLDKHERAQASLVHPSVGTSAESVEACDAATDDPVSETSDPAELSRLLCFLRGATGLDFTHYKSATVRRRIERRMRLTESDSVSTYLEHLRNDPLEVTELHGELLLRVTRFFRDPDAFDVLKRCLPRVLARSRREGRTVRIWVPGCATGEEPYSIAMCALECLQSMSGALASAVQVFATDVHEASIVTARAGLYPASAHEDVGQERLRRFFTEHANGYQLSAEVRSLCVFARHDLIRDPPFSRLDLISCRNVLIYLEREAQQRVLAKFQRALTPAGLLLLGRSESLSNQSPLFQRFDRHERLYEPRPLAPNRDARRKVGPSSFTSLPSKPCILAPMGYDVRKEADRVLLGRFVSAAILVDAQLQVIQFRGQTGPFMGPVSGAASLHVLKLVDAALLPALRYGLASVQKTKQVYRRKGVVADLRGTTKMLDLEILPLRAPDSDEAGCLIVLSPSPAAEKMGAPSASGAEARMIAQLRDELAITRDHLHASVAEQECSNESLRAALEELQSANEELQASNEELETGKEELQSANEELTTANDEIQMRNAELNQLIHDHINLVEAANVAAILFGRDMRLRYITPVVVNLTRLTPGDLGRPLEDLRIGLEGCDLAKVMRDALEGLAPQELELRGDGGRRYAATARPYPSLEGQLDGVVMILSEVTKLRAMEEALQRANARISALESAASGASRSN